MSVIADLPDLRPSLLLDFANSRRVDPRIQCTRASTATCFGPDGKLRTVAANVPRIDFDPATGKCLGLLIEESRTNLILHSGNLGNFAWVKSPSITVTAEADDWWDISHNGSGNFAAVCQEGRPNSNEYATFTFDIKPGSLSAAQMLLGINGASNAARVAFDFAEGSSTISNTLGVITPAMVTHSIKHMGDYWRCTLSVDTSSTSIVPTSNSCFLYTGGNVSMQTAGNIKARRGQLESAKFPSNYTPTVDASVTRAADLVSMDYAQDGSEGSLLVDAVVRGSTSANFVARLHELPAHYMGIGYSSASNMTRSGFVRASADSGATLAAPSTGGSIAFGNTVRIAIAWGGGVFRVAFGGVVSADTPPASVFPDTSKLILGVNSNGGEPRSAMTISRVAVYSKQLTALQLQRLTQL